MKQKISKKNCQKHPHKSNSPVSSKVAKNNFYTLVLIISKQSKFPQNLLVSIIVSSNKGLEKLLQKEIISKSL
jgi:hypothetical protein